MRKKSLRKKSLRNKEEEKRAEKKALDEKEKLEKRSNLGFGIPEGISPKTGIPSNTKKASIVTAIRATKVLGTSLDIFGNT